MKGNILTFSIYESSISIIFGILALLLALKFIEKLIIKTSLKSIVEEKNTALAIFLGAVLFCFMNLTMISILPSVNYLQSKMYSIPILEFSFYLYAFLTFLVGFVFCFCLASAVLFLGTKVFFMSTRNIDEIGEVKKNNVSISIVISFAIISLTLFIKPSLANLLKSIINYMN